MKITRKAETLRARAERLMEEADKLDSLPDEPEGDEDGANVIWWLQSFGGPRNYTYAAVKAGDGLWYTTGPRSPKGYTWDQLVEWIVDANGTDVEIWTVSEWSPLTD